MERIAVLVAQAQIQDSLLQSYRQILLTLQSVLLAVGTFAFSKLEEASDLNPVIMYSLIILALCSIAIYSIIKIRGVITHRGKDVNFWHRKIIEAEQDLEPGHRDFMSFKHFQQNKRRNADLKKEPFTMIDKLSWDEICKLVGDGLGHTRKVMDYHILNGILGVWCFILIASTYIVSAQISNVIYS